MSQQLQAEVNRLKILSEELSKRLDILNEVLSKRLEKLETPPPKQDKRRGKR